MLNDLEEASSFCLFIKEMVGRGELGDPGMFRIWCLEVPGCLKSQVLFEGSEDKPSGEGEESLEA